MSEQEKHTRQKIHECVYPGSRFALIADHILEIHGSETDENTVSALWFGNEDYDKYYLYRFHKEDSLHTIYRLTHHDRRYSHDGMTRYTVIVTGEDVSNVMYINDSNLVVSLDGRMQRTTSNEALAILSKKAPEAAREAETKMFDKAFRRTVGNYILSDLAADEHMQAWDFNAVRYAANAHYTRTASIISDENQEARSLPHSDEHPRPDHQIRVKKAGESFPQADGRNHFKKFNLTVAASEIAEELDYTWQHHVSWDTDHFASERYMEKRGDS